MASLTDEEFELYDDYLNGRIAPDALEDEVIYGILRKALTGDVFPEVLQASRELLQRDPSTWPVGMSKETLEAMSQAITRGLAEGLHPDQTAKYLDMVTDLTEQGKSRLRNYLQYLQETQPNLSPEEFQARLNRMHQMLLNERRRVIAQTEQAYAVEKGRLLRARRKGKYWKVWQTVGDKKVSEICDRNQAAGWIHIDAAFPNKAQCPPGHVRCRCTTSFRGTEPDQNAEERVDARRKKTAVAKAGETPTESMLDKVKVAEGAGVLTRAAAKEASEAIDSVHQLPEDMPRVFVDTDNTVDGFGAYYPVSKRIALNETQGGDALTMLHEMGHYLDWEGFKPRGYYTSSSGSRHLEEFYEFVRNSQHFQELMRLRDSGVLDEKRFNYLSNPEELFARAYAQFIATEAGKPAIIEVLRRFQAEGAYQWSDDDFAPIGALLKELFGELGWMKGSPND